MSHYRKFQRHYHLSTRTNRWYEYSRHLFVGLVEIIPLKPPASPKKKTVEGGSDALDSRPSDLGGRSKDFRCHVTVRNTSEHLPRYEETWMCSSN